MIVNKSKKNKKLNINKKGFTLIELLAAVAIIAIMTPVLIEGFTHATKLNYRSRLQQRADAAANSVYEGIASVDYSELGDYLSALNGWQAIDDGTGSGYEYYVTKPYDGIEDCQIKVAVQKYSQSYVVPDLNFVGVKSKYLTLADEVNDSDSIVKTRFEQAIKSNDGVKTAIKQDIVAKIHEKTGIVISATDVVTSRILVNCGNIEESKISKMTSVYIDAVDDKFSADYTVSYRYPAETPNPTYDTASLKVGYSYSHYLNGKWISVEGENIDVQENLRTVYQQPDYRFELKVDIVNETISVTAEKDKSGFLSDQTMFIYYNALSPMDWIDLKTGPQREGRSFKYNIFFIEQKSSDGTVLNLNKENVYAIDNNFKYSGVNPETNDYTILTQDARNVYLYSNNTSIAASGIPDRIYESSEAEASMYRVQVSVLYKSEIFADIKGSFQAGGGSVNQYSK